MAEDRTFQFLHAAGGNDFVNSVRAFPDLLPGVDVTYDRNARTLQVRGALPEEMAAAVWLFDRIDGNAGAGQLASGDGVFEALVLEHTGYGSGTDQMGATIRSVTDIRQMWVDGKRKLILFKSSPAQAMDGKATPVTLDLRALDPSESTVAVLYVKGPLAEAALEVRKTTRVRRITTVGVAKALILRGTPEQVAQAQQLLAGRN
jgi:hypothetical protein